MQMDTAVQSSARQPQVQMLPDDISFRREKFHHQFTKPLDGEEGKRQLQQFVEALIARKRARLGLAVQPGS
eukprot:11165359-Lingulodinium_polyedra.AAC.1